MAIGSFSSSGLYELDNTDIDRMLGLDETLFVEHKRGLGSQDKSFQLVRAIAAFANTAGGWILLGVHEGKIVADSESLWQQPNSPSLVDMVRDRVRGQLDPVPAFEAAVRHHADGPVAIVRVYESSDTPHIMIRNGAVYVREVAGIRDATHPARSGAGAAAERAFKATTVGSRADLLQLSARGDNAEERVTQLLNTPYVSPLIAMLGLVFHQTRGGLQPMALNHGLVHVRVAPYTLPARFRGWATTLDAAGAVLRAAEDLADVHGLVSSWVTPHPAGASIEVQHADPAPHSDRWARASAHARVAIDGEGVAGAALRLDPPNREARLASFSLDHIADSIIFPVVRAASAVLTAGEFVGRCRCQIDLVGMHNVLRVESQGNQQTIASWVPVTTDLTLAPTDEELQHVGLTAARTLARSAGLPFWDFGRQRGEL